MAGSPTPSPATSETRGGIERRVAVRHYPNPKTNGNVNPPRRRPFKAIIRDLSTTGIGLVLNQGFDAGTELAVELQSPDQLLLYTVLTRVAHCTAQTNGSFVLGCSFVRELSEEELRNLL